MKPRIQESLFWAFYGKRFSKCFLPLSTGYRYSHGQWQCVGEYLPLSHPWAATKPKLTSHQQQPRSPAGSQPASAPPSRTRTTRTTDWKWISIIVSGVLSSSLTTKHRLQIHLSSGSMSVSNLICTDGKEGDSKTIVQNCWGPIRNGLLYPANSWQTAVSAI